MTTHWIVFTFWQGAKEHGRESKPALAMVLQDDYNAILGKSDQKVTVYWNGGPGHMVLPAHEVHYIATCPQSVVQKDTQHHWFYQHHARRRGPLAPDKLEVTEGWLAPDGKFYACDYGEHIQEARALVAQLYNEDGDERFLEQRGWRKITMEGVVSWRAEKPLTKAQADTIQDLASIGTDHWRKRMNEELLLNGYGEADPIVVVVVPEGL